MIASRQTDIAIESSRYAGADDGDDSYIQAGRVVPTISHRRRMAKQTLEHRTIWRT